MWLYALKVLFGQQEIRETKVHPLWSEQIRWTSTIFGQDIGVEHFPSLVADSCQPYMAAVQSRCLDQIIAHGLWCNFLSREFGSRIQVGVRRIVGGITLHYARDWLRHHDWTNQHSQLLSLSVVSTSCSIAMSWFFRGTSDWCLTRQWSDYSERLSLSVWETILGGN